MKHLFSLAMALVVWHMPLTFLGQNPDSFPFSLEVTAVDIPDLPGIHSYAQAQHEGKWLILGGRLDGLHARQPFNAFPAGSNNTLMMVVDIDEGTVHTASVDALAPSVAEQLQSSNMNFHQVGDVLYLVGGYAYSASAEDHMTHPRLTALSVPGFINAIVQGGTFDGLYDSVEDDYFAVTGGHLNRLGDRLALVGGHRFDGRYNPMGHPTYIQAYTNAIRLFSASFLDGTVEVGDFETWSDEVHLHRRDYNLLPFKTNDGTNGLTLFSGVFQINEDLPFLYPVSITEEGHEPVTEFNQHLSQYHSGCVSLYDQTTGQTHSLFFGGMSQFQLDENNDLVEDPLVPFVNTISRVVRHGDGSFEEFQLPATMGGLHGTSAGFFVAEGLPLDAATDLVLMDELGESLTLGYVVGGINSGQTNPFSFNQTDNTNASSSVYQVTLTRTSSTGEVAIQRPTSPSFAVYPNPTDGEVQLTFELKTSMNVDLLVTDNLGRLVMNQSLGQMAAGTQLVSVEGLDGHAGETMLVTLVFDHQSYASHPVLVLD
jgi:hypothetical protein